VAVRVAGRHQMARQASLLRARDGSPPELRIILPMMAHLTLSLIGHWVWSLWISPNPRGSVGPAMGCISLHLSWTQRRDELMADLTSADPSKHQTPNTGLYDVFASWRCQTLTLSVSLSLSLPRRRTTVQPKTYLYYSHYTLQQVIKTGPFSSAGSPGGV
jgi:hypothetical protein